MKFAEVRDKFPQYNDLSDQQLAEGLHKKYYSDIPFEEFGQKVGYSQNPDVPANDEPDTGAMPVVSAEVKKSPSYLDIASNVIEGAIPRVKQHIGGAIRALGEEFSIGGDDVLVENTGGIHYPSIPGLIKLGVASMGFGDEAKAMAGIGEDVAIDAQKEVEKVDKKLNLVQAEEFFSEDQFKYYLKNGGDAIVNMIPMLATTVITKNPEAGLALMGTQVYGQEYQDMRAKGYSEADAKQAGIFFAATEAIPEKIPLGILTKEGGKLLARMLKAGGSEAIQEEVTEMLQAGYEKGVLNENMTWGEVATRLRDAPVIGFMAGSGLAAAMHTIVGGEDGSVEETDLINIDKTPDYEGTNKPLMELPAPTMIVDQEGNIQTEAQIQQGNQAAAERSGMLGITPDIAAAGPMHPGYQNLQPEPAMQPYVEPPTLALPAPSIQVDPQGNAGTQAQFENAARQKAEFAESTSLTPDVITASQKHPARPNSEETIAAREKMELRLPPNYQDKRLARTVFRTSLNDMASQLVKGGGITLTGGQFTPDAEGISVDKLEPVKRTQSQNPKWFQGMAVENSGVTVEKLQHAVSKAIEGKKLGVGEIRWVADMLDQVTGERTDPEVIAWRRGELETARKYRQEAARGLPPSEAYESDAENAGEIFNEDEYDPEWDGRGRTLFELLEDAKTVDEGRAFEIFESEAGNFIVAARLAELIHEGKSNEVETEQTAPVDTGAIEEEQRTAEVASPEVQATVETGPDPDSVTGPPQTGEKITTQTPADAGVSVSTVGNTGLLGQDVTQQQAIADRQNEIDEKLGKNRQHIPAESAGDLFDPNREKQIDLIDTAAHAAATSPHNELPEPSPAQVDAGNYKHGHVKVHGLDISIENPVGSIRKSKPGAKVTWEREMQDHYGYIKKTTGADGEHVDAFVGSTPESNRVFVIDQVNQTGSFDEHKIMLGYSSPAAARTGYLRNYQKGWTGLGQMSELTVDEFKDWLKTGDTKAPYSTAIKKNPEQPTVEPVAESQAPVPSSVSGGDGITPVQDNSGPDSSAKTPAPVAKQKSAKPLSSIKITDEIYIEDTGQTVKVTQTAEVLMNEANTRIAGIKSLIACLRA